MSLETERTSEKWWLSLTYCHWERVGQWENLEYRHSSCGDSLLSSQICFRRCLLWEFTVLNQYLPVCTGHCCSVLHTSGHFPCLMTIWGGTITKSLFGRSCRGWIVCLDSLCIWLSQQLSHTVEMGSPPGTKPHNTLSLVLEILLWKQKQFPFVDAVFWQCIQGWGRPEEEP